MVFRCAELSKQSDNDMNARTGKAALHFHRVKPSTRLVDWLVVHEPTQWQIQGSAPSMTLLIGVSVNAPSPRTNMAAQKPIFATVLAKSSGEKFV
jgi:hypothetical protein